MILNFGYNKQPYHYDYGGSTTPVEEYATTRTKPPHSCVFNSIVYTHDDCWRHRSHSPYFVQVEAGGHFSDYMQNLPNSDSGNSLISLPPAHIWPSRHP